jgi:hypothetical protein
VSGFVAIYINKYPDVVWLPRLEVIRGNETFSARAVKGVKDVTLLIALSSHSQIHMPRLRGI